MGRLALKPQALRYKIEDFRFLSDEDTIRFLKENKIGIVRFGDGELNFIAGYPAIHQTQNAELRQKLKKILSSYKNPKNYLVGLPLDIILTGNFKERNTSYENWRAPKYAALPFLHKGATYAPYCSFRIEDVLCKNKEQYIERVLRLFENRNIIYVGGADNYSEFISPVKTIKVPTSDAFIKYNEVMEAVKNETKNFNNLLVLISAGVTGTALSAELNNEGILTYDIGSLFSQLKKF